MPTSSSLIAAHPIAALAPELALTLFAVAVLIAAAFLPLATSRLAVPVLAGFGTLVSAFGCIGLWSKGLLFGPADSAIYVADDFSLFLKGIFLAGLFVTILVSGRFLDARSGDRHTVAGEYYALLMLSTVGMMMVASARDLLVIFLGIETLSIALYVLAGFARAKVMSNEAALKYFLLGAFATGFLLYGIALTYFSLGTTFFPAIVDRLTSAEGVGSRPILMVGLALMLIGLSFKAALVPFHQWTPDVYEGSPTPVTGFMAVGAKAAAFAAILRVFGGAFAPAYASWHNIMVAIAVLTMTVGNVIALSQTSLKRTLAYSSIAHAGYILIGVLAIGPMLGQANMSGVQQATSSVLLYLAIYALMNLGAFATLVYIENLRADEGTNVDTEDGNVTLRDLRGLIYRSPLAGAALTIFLLSLAGIPPMAGFLAKLFVFRAALNAGETGLVIVAALNSVISVYYYLRPILEMSTRDDSAPSNIAITPGGAAIARPTTMAPSVGVAIALCAVGVLALFGVFKLLNNGATAAAGTLSPVSTLTSNS